MRFTEQAQTYSQQVGAEADFYFVHSYRFEVEDPTLVAGTGNYDGEFVAMVRRDNVVGMQFHPEKSQSNGLKLLQAFFS